MEYLEGDDLKALMKKGFRFTDAELCKWWNQIADALNYTHAQGIVHRDIKPSNIFLDKKGNIKLLDFGIAKIKESISLTMTGAMMGTLMYMSPEQVEDSKHIGPQSDIYSLAVTFVHLLTGKAPYDITNSSDYAIRKSIVEIPLDLAALPASWRLFLEPYLNKDPQERPALKPFAASAPEHDDEVTAVGSNAVPLEDDEATLVGDAVKQSPEPAPTPAPKAPTSTAPPKPTKKKAKTIGLVIAGVAVAALLAILLWPSDSAKKDEKKQVEFTERKSSVRMSGDDLVFTVDDGREFRYKMVHVDGGTFTMGATPEQGSDAWDNENPAHQETVSNYYIGETEVTQALWKEVMGYNPSYSQSDNLLPVENVSWDDVQDFIKRLNQLTGRTFRLPTEAEWEYAARGGNRSRGYKYSGGNDIGAVAWYDGNSGYKTHLVKCLQANELGLYDMSGNVWEWCEDCWRSDYNSGADCSGRVLRGGSWSYSARYCRVSDRGNITPSTHAYNGGFRLVLSR